MAGERTLKVTILGDSKDAEKAFDRLGKASDSVHSTIKNVGLAIAGAFTVTAGVGLVKGFLAEAEEARKSSAQTAAVIKSTGGAAHVSAKDIDSLSSSLSNKIGVDDEAIASGANLLLTFTEVQNRVGKGNDVFNQATDVMTDMSAALGQDMPASAMQLGKALNDPIRGVTALRRVGVTFTKQQEDQIAKMQKAGDVAGAQKIILAELRKEFGGSAEAQATAGQKLGVIWGNLQEQIGTALLPVFDKVATWLGSVLPRAVAVATTVVSKVVDVVKAFAYTLGTGFTEDEGTPIERFALTLRKSLVPAIQSVQRLIREIVLDIQLVIAAFKEGDVTSSGWHGTMEKLGILLRQIADWIQNNLTPVLIGLGAAILLLIGGPWALLIGGLIAAYLKFGWFRDGVNAVVQAVAVSIQWLADQVGVFVAWWESIWPQVSEAVSHVMNVIRDVITVVLAVVEAVWRTFGDNILGVVGAVWSQIQNIIDTAVRVIRDIITVVLAVINGDWGRAWNAIKDIPAAAFDFIINMVQNAIKVIGEYLSAAGKVISGAASGMFDGIKDAFRAAINFIIRGWNGLQFKMPEVDTHIPGIGKVGGFTLGVPNIPTLHSGGVFHAPPGQSEGLALLREGERVTRAGGGGAAITVNATLNATFTGRPDPEAEAMIERRLAGFANTLARAVATA